MFKMKIIIGFIVVILLSGCDQELNELNKIDKPLPEPDATTIAYTPTGLQGWHIALSYAPYAKNYDISTGFFDTNPSWSPDKKEIVYARNSGTGIFFQLWKMRYDGSNKTQLTPNDIYCTNAKFSPDGKKIVFVVSTELRSDIYIMDSEGNNWKQITDSSTFSHYNLTVSASWPDWSPDGKKIIFSYGSANLEINGLAIINIQNNTYFEVKIPESVTALFEPIWSPKGDEIVFIGNNDERGPKIFRMNIDGSNLTQLTFSWGSFEADWDTDGSMIAYTNVDSISGNPSIWTMNHDGADKRKVIEIPGGAATLPSW